MLPIENSSAGAVTDNYDLLLKYDNVIVAETFLPVHHYLLGTPDAELSDVKRVYAHPQALMQSSDFLNQHDWQQLSMENNAVAAQKVRDEKDPSQAAVAGEVAGEIYGLKKAGRTDQQLSGQHDPFPDSGEGSRLSGGRRENQPLLRAAAPQRYAVQHAWQFYFQ